MVVCLEPISKKFFLRRVLNSFVQESYRKLQVNTHLKYYRIDRREISFLKFIIEAYDGTAVVTTVDPDAGVVSLHIAPGCEPVVNMILEDLKQSILIEPLAPPDL